MSQTPNILAIVLGLQAVFQGISISGGYNYDIKASSVVLDPVNLATIATTELPFLTFGEGADGIDRSYKTTQPVEIREKRRIWLCGRVDATNSDTAARWTALSMLEQDIEAALSKQLSAAGPLYGGGTAMFVEAQTPTYYPGLPNQLQAYLRLPLDVLYRRNFGAP